MSERSVFLLIEDNDNDTALIRRAFREAKVLNPLMVVSSGEEGIKYFLGQGPYGNRAEFPMPSVVLLDLGLRGMDGFEFLRWLRQQADIQNTRVVVLTSVSSPDDVKRAYEMGANSFLVKPTDFEKFVEISRALKGYWVWADAPPVTPQSAAGPAHLKS